MKMQSIQFINQKKTKEYQLILTVDDVLTNNSIKINRQNQELPQ